MNRLKHLLLLTVATALAGCASVVGSGGSPSPQPFSRTLTPASSIVHGGDTQQFTAKTSDGSNPSLAWSVNGAGGGNAAWIPATALDQYAATVASWFGVSDAHLPAIFPNLNNFSTHKLGFMG